MDKIVRWYDFGSKMLELQPKYIYFVLLFVSIHFIMQPLLTISTVTLHPEESQGMLFDMSGRCAFAVCKKGRFEIRILNELYSIGERSIFACMPFVSIEVVSVAEVSEIIFGYIKIEDVPKMINRWINSTNLIAIQDSPTVEVPAESLDRILSAVDEYTRECGDLRHIDNDKICDRIHSDVIYLRGLLLVAQVIELFFENISMKLGGHNHRDEVFQRFMLTLYANFREQRKVNFYADRSGMSPKYFSTIVKELSGASPSQWIETVVIGEAKSMLRDERHSIKDISTALNFPDAPTFTKYFHRVTGLTPKSFRKSGE